MATFAAMVDHQDQSIGLLLDYLRRTKHLDITLIIYLTDNGPEAFDGQGGVISNAQTVPAWRNQAPRQARTGAHYFP